MFDDVSCVLHYQPYGSCQPTHRPYLRDPNALPRRVCSAGAGPKEARLVGIIKNELRCFPSSSPNHPTGSLARARWHQANSSRSCSLPFSGKNTLRSNIVYQIVSRAPYAIVDESPRFAGTAEEITMLGFVLLSVDTRHTRSAIRVLPNFPPFLPFPLDDI